MAKAGSLATGSARARRDYKLSIIRDFLHGSEFVGLCETGLAPYDTTFFSDHLPNTLPFVSNYPDPLPGHPKAGVAILLRKDYALNYDITPTELIPGYVLSLSLSPRTSLAPFPYTFSITITYIPTGNPTLLSHCFGRMAEHAKGCSVVRSAQSGSNSPSRSFRSGGGISISTAPQRRVGQALPPPTYSLPSRPSSTPAASPRSPRTASHSSAGEGPASTQVS